MASSFPTPAAQTFQLELPAHTLLTLPDAAGLGIECSSGSVWVTLDHDPRDIVLSAGERYEADVHRRALVSALEPSSITVSQGQLVARSRGANARVCLEVPRRPIPTGLSPA